MTTIANIGKWTAKADNSGTKAQITVDGSFPVTEKPIFTLREADSPSINQTILRLYLEFGELLDENASSTGETHKSFVVNDVEQYETVTVEDKNGRSIAYIKVEPAL